MAAIVLTADKATSFFEKGYRKISQKGQEFLYWSNVTYSPWTSLACNVFEDQVRRCGRYSSVSEFARHFLNGDKLRGPNHLNGKTFRTFSKNLQRSDLFLKVKVKAGLAFCGTRVWQRVKSLCSPDYLFLQIVCSFNFESILFIVVLFITYIACVR